MGPLKQKLYIFMQSDLPIFTFVACTSDVTPKKSLPNIMKLSLAISSKNFIFLGLTFMLFTHIMLIFAYRVKLGVQLHSFTCGYPVFSTPFVEKIVLSPLEHSWYPYQQFLTMYARAYFWALCL